MIPLSRFHATRPLSRARRILDAIVDGEPMDPDDLPLDGPVASVGEDDMLDALADLEHRIVAIEAVLRRSKLYPPQGPGQPTAGTVKPSKPDAR